jgi:hypothetical protein
MGNNLKLRTLGYFDHSLMLESHHQAAILEKRAGMTDM